MLSFSGASGWGFILSGREDDVIFRHSQTNGGGCQMLRVGDMAKFDLIYSETGPEAHNIKVLPPTTVLAARKFLARRRKVLIHSVS